MRFSLALMWLKQLIIIYHNARDAYSLPWALRKIAKAVAGGYVARLD